MIDDKRFLQNYRSWPTDSIQMKLWNPKGGMPVEFGVIFKSDPLAILLFEIKVVDGKSDVSLTGEERRFDSFDQMLGAGWLVD